MAIYCPFVSMRARVCCRIYSHQCEVLAAYDRTPVVAEGGTAVALHVCPSYHDQAACERYHYAFSDLWVEDGGSQALFVVTTPHPRDHHCPCLRALDHPPVALARWSYRSDAPQVALARLLLQAELDPEAKESSRTDRADRCRLIARE